MFLQNRAAPPKRAPSAVYIAAHMEKFKNV